jgi:DNA modification methylase
MGDSIELLTQLEDDSVAAVITDPPYSSGGRTANERAQTPSNKYEQSSNKFVHRPGFPRGHNGFTVVVTLVYFMD